MPTTLPHAIPMTAPATADEDLVRRCVDEQDEGAFYELVTRYRDRVFRLAISILGPGGELEAEDVAQEVFLQVHRKLATFRSESRFSTWLYRVAQRHALNLKRRARYRYPHRGEAALAHLTEREQPREAQLDLHAAVEALDEPVRSIVLLRYWLGESIAGIAALHRMRPGTVKSHLYRARARLAKVLRSPE